MTPGRFWSVRCASGDLTFGDYRKCVGHLTAKDVTRPVPSMNHDDSSAEKRLALVHRVIIPDEDYPKEYAILLTNRRLVFIRQEKTRRPFVLRYEMKIGTALVTDVVPKVLEDYAQTSMESLAADTANIVIPLERIESFVMGADELKRRRRDFMLWFVMNRQKEIFQVYNFQIAYSAEGDKSNRLKFYAVPLGAYFKPRRLTQTREAVLREYAESVLEALREAIPAGE